jgi:hypothetical protein
MKPNWRTAHVSVRQQIEAYLADGTPASWKKAADLSWSMGCDIEAPTTKASEKIAELRESKDFRELNRLYMLTNIEAEARQEAANLARWQGMRKFASEPSNAERHAESLAQAQAAAREAEIEARALAIVAEQNRSALTKARQQAKREIEGTR